ncbi:MAG: dockerin type I repeat-containing protein [Ruminococcus sp.]|nr:dockerin type I repeat-containing protein [Ruminococcus sp.]
MKIQKHFKKNTALLLVLILAVSSFALPASAAKDSDPKFSGSYTTMQLLNSAGWSKIYMHAVNADGDELSGVFPGIEVKEMFLDRIGRKVYIAVIPENVTEIYFNDGGSNRTDVITDFKNGLFKILSQKDGQEYCECMLDEDYGEGKTIWLQKHDGWDQTFITPKDKDRNPLYDSPLDITSYQTYRYTDDSRYYMLTLPADYKSFTITNGSESLGASPWYSYQRFDYTLLEDIDNGGFYETIVSNYLYNISNAWFTKYQYGDADLDSEISINDVTKIQSVLAALRDPMSTLNSGVADTDGDGAVTISDATAIQYYLASLSGSERTGREYRRAENYGMHDYFCINNNCGWDKIYLYALDADDNPICGDFPGYLLTKTETYNKNHHYTDIPKNAAKLIFSNGNGEYSTPVDPSQVPERDPVRVGQYEYKTYYVDITDQKNEEGHNICEIKYSVSYIIVDP